MKKRKPIEMTYDDGVTPGDQEAPGLAEALKSPGKLRITTWIDEDVVDKLKELAGHRGYQTLLNRILREKLFSRSTEDNDDLIQRAVAAIEATLVPQIEANLERKWTRWTRDFLASQKAERKPSHKRKAGTGR